MTRINVLAPEDLTDSHLMAEYRELPMVHGSLARTLKSKRGVDYSRISPKYTLNTGHVYQFYNKGKWLHERYEALIAELRSRGYQVDPDSRSVNWSLFTENGLYGDWVPDEGAYVVNADRILLRIQQKPHLYAINKQKIIVDQYVDMIKTKYYTAENVE